MKRIIIEVNKGRVWWVSSHTDDWEVMVINHDEGMMRIVPTKLCSQDEIEDKFELCKTLEKEGMTEDFEKRLQDVDPKFFLEMKEIQQQEKERKEEK